MMVKRLLLNEFDEINKFLSSFFESLLHWKTTQMIKLTFVHLFFSALTFIHLDVLLLLC